MAVNTLTDSELIDQLVAGEESALNTIFTKYWHSLFVAAHNILKDKSLCEDIIQETFINLWNKRQTLSIKISLKAYLYACVRYAVYRQIKAGNVREEIFEHLGELSAPPAYKDLEYRELVTQINSVVETLPEKCKEVYKLSREEHLSHKEIACRLNISPKTVENHITKALKHLRISVGDVPVLLVFFDILSHYKK